MEHMSESESNLTRKKGLADLRDAEFALNHVKKQEPRSGPRIGQKKKLAASLSGEIHPKQYLFP
jgi:hypothetical protein